ncbi:MAG: SDR family oxidoreductase [Chloroflexi bacterium]|nr:SDR family oxidoreductase [Chloroflexota bacterium]
MLEISGAVAVITGGGSGIGETVAKHWVKNGGKVVLADMAIEQLRRVEKDIGEMGGEVAVTACDVTREEDNHALARLAVEKFGAINLIVPCAGIIKDGLMLAIDRETGKVEGKMSREQFQAVLDVNLTGAFLTVRECAEQMINLSCRGLICLISSTGSLGTAGQLNYSSSKAAMSVMPRVLTAEFFRRDIAGRVRCVAVAPGYVATSMVKGMNQKALDRILEQVPIGRLVEPEEVASLIGELYRNEACAGEVFYIHGGLHLGSRG